MKRCCWICALPGLIGLSEPATAAVIRIDASVITEVQELIGGLPGSMNRDEIELDADGATLPLVAVSSLVSTDLQGRLVAMARGATIFEDPTRLDQPNPEEFGIEAACFSDDPDIAYTVSGDALESRTVVFTTPGNPLAPPEIEFGVTRRRVVESRLFLSGAVVLWSTMPGRNLDDLFSELRATIRRDDTGETLFESALTLFDDGDLPAAPAVDGPIQFADITLDELREAGVDEASLAVLEAVEAAGTLLILAIPPQEHPYRYTVTADEPLDLTAHLSITARNMPDGTGVAATLGRPFESLAGFIAEAMPGVDGEEVQRSVNAITQAKAIGRVESSRLLTPGLINRACGAFGAEPVALAALLVFGSLRRRRTTTRVTDR